MSSTVAGLSDSNRPTSTRPGPASAPSKRQRVSRACDQCRTMREKCDGTQPQCSSCQIQNRSCTYKTSPKKRGVQTGYIRALELTLSLLLDQVPGSTEVLENLFSRQEEAQRLFSPESGGQDSDRHIKLHRRWVKSKARREIQRILSNDPSDAKADTGSEDGHDSDNGLRPAIAGLGGFGRPPTSVPPGWSPDASTDPSPRTGGLVDDGGASSHSVLTMPPNWRQLLDIYISYTQCWFPISDRDSLLQTAVECESAAFNPGAASSFLAARPPQISELLSAFALASCQNTANLEISSGPLGTAVLKPHEVYYKRARDLLPTDCGPFDIAHSRALLILALVNIGQRNHAGARIQVGMARQIAEEYRRPSIHQLNQIQPLQRRLELQPRPSDKVIDTILIGCCILDALLVVSRTTLQPTLPHPVHLDSNATVHATHECAASIAEDGLEEWQTWAGCVGVGNGQAAIERGPAYAISSFNQLHSILMTLQQRLATNSDAFPVSTPSDPVAGDAYTLDTRALDRTVRHDLPFSSFIRANDRNSTTVPSAYIVRVIFVWAHVLLSAKRRVSNITQSVIVALADAVEQYIVKFGAAAVPSIFVPLVHSVLELTDFQSSQRMFQQRWMVLVDVIETCWGLRIPRDLSHPSQQAAIPGSTHPGAATSQPGAIPIGLTGPLTLGQRAGASHPNSETSPVFGQSFSVSSHVPLGTSTGVFAGSVQGGHETLGLGRVRIEASPGSHGSPPSTTDTNSYHLTGVNAIKPSQSGGDYGPSSSAAPGTLTKRANDAAPGMTNAENSSGEALLGQPSIPTTHPATLSTSDMEVHGLPSTTQISLDPGFNTSVEYDSLLHDLATGDYLEILDADIGNQFMANLGFAPGSGNLGTVMGEYGGL